jgi:flavin-dependent dehydrogenase
MQVDLSNIAIIGAGPGGCVLGRLLKEAGHVVTIFDPGKRPDLIVGESLIPALMPLIRELGLEKKVEEIGQYKPGASMFFPDGLEWRLNFSENEDFGDHYAYNVPRDSFDRLFKDMSIDFGCEIISEKAELQSCAQEPNKVSIKGYNDFTYIIDASGRNRVLSKFLGIPTKTGKRKDLAIFAHCNEAQLPHGGNIHLGVSDHGWSWRIPLQGKVSIGVVASNEYLQTFGMNDEEKIDNLLHDCDFLAPYVNATTKRISGTARYSNYQLITDRLYGQNWALLGDAAGFIDPVFSSGTFLAVSAAKKLADCLLSQSSSSAFENYEKEYRQHLSAWQALVDSFYDRRFIKMIRVAAELEANGRAFQGSKGIVCRIVSGVSICDPEILAQFELLIKLAGQHQFSNANNLRSEQGSV